MNSTNTLFLDHDKLEDDDDDDEGDLVEGVKIKIKKAMRCDATRMEIMVRGYFRKSWTCIY